MKFETIERDGQKVIIPIAQTFRDCMLLCQSDQYRVDGKINHPAKLILCSILKPFSKKSLLVWFRLCALKSKLSTLPFQQLYKICSHKYNIDIPPKTKIGFGFYIGHGMCIVVNEDTVIGNNVSVSQFLNIGTNHNKPALIADNVYIAPMCCIVEDVVIGENCVIGAGAVVTKNIPAYTTAAGVPARVINDRTKKYIINPYNLDISIKDSADGVAGKRS